MRLGDWMDYALDDWMIKIIKARSNALKCWQSGVY